jgi:homoserine dehydrogenase
MIKSGGKSLIPPLGHFQARDNDISIQPIEDLETAYYFRFSAVDKPGVLSKIAGILGDNRISISSVIQKGREMNGSVPIVMLTHEAMESDVIKALALIDKLDVLTDKTMMIRVEEG